MLVFQSTVIAVVPPVGPPIVVPVGRAVRNIGVYLDDRFKVNLLHRKFIKPPQERISYRILGSTSRMQRAQYFRTEP